MHSNQTKDSSGFISINRKENNMMNNIRTKSLLILVALILSVTLVHNEQQAQAQLGVSFCGIFFCQPVFCVGSSSDGFWCNHIICFNSDGKPISEAYCYPN